MRSILTVAVVSLLAGPAFADDGSCSDGGDGGGRFGFLRDAFENVVDAKDFVEDKIEEGRVALKVQTPDDLLPWRGPKDPGTPAKRTDCNGRPGGLKVMSYNVRSTRDSSMNQIARDINAQGVDFVGLQEVDMNGLRSGHRDQAKELAEKTGLRHHAFGSIGYRNVFVGEYGNAILSKYQIIETRTFMLPSGTEQRVMICAKVIAPTGETMVCNTHLGLNGEERKKQTAAIHRIIGGFDTDRVVLMGDFNETADKPAMGFLRSAGYRDAWEMSGKGNGFTSTPASPKKRIDFVLLGPGMESAGCAGVPKVSGSDHLPVVTTVY